MKRYFSMIALAIAAAVLLAACGGETPGGDAGDDGDDKGTFAGRITIGPVCPVEPCDFPEGAIYMGRDLVFLRSGASSFKVPLGTDGSFSVELVPADYIIGMEGCGYVGCDVFPMEQTIVSGETVTFNRDFDTGIRAPGQDAVARFVADIVALGVPVAQGGTIDQPFFSVPGREVIFDGQTVQTYSYESSDAAQADASQVSASGSGVGTSMISWIATPHFYLKGSLMVLYVGDNGTVMARLETVLGPQFAGGDPPLPTTVHPDDPTADPDAKVQAYLDVLDEMTDALGQLSRGPDGGSMERVREIGARYEDFVIFFVSLQGERRDYVTDTYGEQIKQSVERVVGVAQLAVDVTGDQSIEAAIHQLLALSVLDLSASTQQSRNVEGTLIVEPTP